MNIKVCGITSGKQLNQLNSLKVDYAGFVFYKDSTRFLSDLMTPDEFDNEDFDIKKVGVFFDEELDTVKKIAEKYHLDFVQLQGDESPAYCKKLSDFIEVIKVIQVKDDIVELLDAIEQYDDCCDYYLFDFGTEIKKSGTGNKINWNMLHEISIEKPFFLSADISVDDIDALLQFNHPDLIAIDISSQFEITPGEKDMSLILKFVHALKYKN